MKKIFLALALLTATAVHAKKFHQDGAFNHLTIGVNAGTTGIGVELGTTISPYFGLRAGYEFMPTFTIKKEVEYERPHALNNVPSELLNERYVDIPEYGAKIDAKGSPSLNQGNILLDIFLGKKSTFHFTVGAYFGKEEIIRLRAADKTIAAVELYNYDIAHGNVLPEPGYEDGISVEFEGYKVGMDRGRAELDLKTQSFRPYVGFGFGRTVPRHTIGCRFDIGVEFIGKYKLYDKYHKVNDKIVEHQITQDEPGISKDFKDVLKYMNNIPVYPCLKFSIVGKIL